MITGRRRKYTGVTPDIAHSELVNRAFVWLKVFCTVVFKERKTAVMEEPDAIGFGGRGTIIIECKTSRADFTADKKKLFRRNPEAGMGHKRYFMASVGLLEPTEIPEGWGLLEVYEIPPMQRSRTVKIAKESNVFYERNSDGEVTYLVSAIRRLNISMAVFVESLESKGEIKMSSIEEANRIAKQFEKSEAESKIRIDKTNNLNRKITYL